jgi:Rrf2 family nitric oxide-sensitive transcriptional repressor
MAAAAVRISADLWRARIYDDEKEGRMRLTVFTDYALRVLLVLAARRGQLVTIAEVSTAFDISEAHLMKVANTLARTGWVETVRGRGGGMRLSANSASLTLREIVETLESDLAIVECFGEQNRCVLTGGCGVARALSRATQAFLAELEQHTLADLAARSPALRKVLT